MNGQPSKERDLDFDLLVRGLCNSRETEWMFSTDAGRLQLSSSAGFDRLVVVSLHRNHVYNDLDAIQAELSAKVMELAPPGFKQGKKVPFLSLGNDIGSRHIVKQGSSNLSGEYVIEEVQGDAGKTFRRLVFLANQNIVQSEARLKTVNVKKKGKGRQSSIVVDKSYLACQHHVAMVAGMSCVQSGRLTDLLEGDMSVLLIGLGGGGLPTYIHQYFPQTTIGKV
ncbi:EFNMT-like protein [Mya arenaria]|uniref:EFNMT-like protein n=1 Tax=Mya arenaria TaxID=6604 RepID=A0ABY7G8M2_MYAAR|nr:EFNMT-like protein [Mya arenaria]